MHFLELTAFIAVFFNLLLTLFILIQAPRAELSRVYAAWGLAVCLWNGGSFNLFRKIENHAYFWACVLHMGVILLPALNLHICLLIAGLKRRKILLAAYLFTGLFLISLFSGFHISREMLDLKYSFYSAASRSFPSFVLFYATTTSYAFLILYKKQRTGSKLQKRRLVWMIGALTILVIFGTNDLLPIIGLRTYPFTNSPIYPFGNIAAIFYVMIVGYSVLQHQLLDVHVALSRFAAQTVRLLFLFTVGFVLLLAISQIAVGYYNTVSFISSLAVIMLSGIIASIFFPKLFGIGSETIEKKILGDVFEYQDKIDALIAAIPWYTDYEQLFEDFATLLRNVIRLGNYHLILLDHTNQRFVAKLSEPASTELSPDIFKTNSKIFELVCSTKEDFYGVVKLRQKGYVKEADELEMLHHAQFCFPFYEEKEPVGLLMVGPKQSRQIFTNTDLDLLTRLVKNLSLIVNQLRLKERIQVEQELDLLGRISKGLAHDLNNLLTPVWTFLQVTASMDNVDPEITPLIESATQNVTAMRNYIRDSLFFSKNMKPQMSVGKVDELVSVALNILTMRAKEKQVVLEFKPQQRIEAVLDNALFQRLVSNLVSNAIDASSDGSTVKVEIQSVRRRENEPDWLQLKVIDHGEGISPENLEKMKAAFFTTKDSGDGKRGFGLGLAICRKIVHLHGGTLNISSQVGKGTTVQVDLPGGSLPVLIAAEPLESATATAA